MQSESPAPPTPTRKGRLFKLGALVLGLGAALYLSAQTPREQHVKLVFGPASSQVTGVELQYLTDGEVTRAARMAFEPSAAPRVVSHDPSLADGDYALRIEVETREGRRSTERRVTLGGGTTQVDLANLLAQPVSAATRNAP